MNNVLSFRIIVCLVFAGLVLNGCAGKKPDLLVLNKTLNKDIPKGHLKFGNCNTVKMQVTNKSKNDGTVVTKTELKIRETNKTGNVVYTGKAKTEVIPGKSKKVAVFKNVNIPKSEITLYYITGTADIDNNEDELNEKNNTSRVVRVIDEDCP